MRKVAGAIQLQCRGDAHDLPLAGMAVAAAARAGPCGSLHLEPPAPAEGRAALRQPGAGQAGDGPRPRLAPACAAGAAADRDHGADPRGGAARRGRHARLVPRDGAPRDGRFGLDARRGRRAQPHRRVAGRGQAVHPEPARRRADRHRRLRLGRGAGAAADHRPRGALCGDRPVRPAARHRGGRGHPRLARDDLSRARVRLRGIGRSARPARCRRAAALASCDARSLDAHPRADRASTCRSSPARTKRPS